MKQIVIKGARTHNLKNISLEIPRNKLVVITGVSGSGKSSLAFDTLFAEGNRRYIESLSVYARQFLTMMDKADVDSIEGLSPAISIEQKSTSHNPRSTVGTITEISDYVRLLFARVGTPHCPTHQISLEAKSVDRMIEGLFEQLQNEMVSIQAPLITNGKGSHQQLFEELKSKGFMKIELNGKVCMLDAMPVIQPKTKHNISLIIDSLVLTNSKRKRISDALELAIVFGKGIIKITSEKLEQPILFSTKFSCPQCDFSLGELEPRLFSFNNPLGACLSCDGLGVTSFIDKEKLIVHPELSIREGAILGWGKQNHYSLQLLESLATYYGFSLDIPVRKISAKHSSILFYGNNHTRIPFTYKGSRGQDIIRKHSFEGIAKQLERRYKETESPEVRDELLKLFSTSVCQECEGSRLNPTARSVKIGTISVPDLANLNIEEALSAFTSLPLLGNKKNIASPIINEIVQRLTFLTNVGLRYLSLNRNANTLSGGETQRIRLASQIGAGLVGVMYVLDEPSIGLHQRDNQKLIQTLFNLRDLGNTVIVVEHDKDAILNADHIVDLGIGAGVEGGSVIASGTPKKIMEHPDSLTGKYLREELLIPIPSQRKSYLDKPKITIKNAHGNNLKNVTVSFPVGCITCVTGVSGSGKSTLINGTLYPIVAHHLHQSESNPKNCDGIENLDLLDKIINIDQSPIGRTPRSNPATYVGLFTLIRMLFSQTPDAKARGFNPGRFSFNVSGGRCEECEGDGLKHVEMNFLADVYVTCELCKGKRFNQETLSIYYRDKNIYDVLCLTILQACEFFKNHPHIYSKLSTLLDVGLGYLTLGQSATTLSGGEAQRIKLSKELSKRNTGKTLYLLDEPTVGLHFHDIAKLIQLLLKLRDQGSTLVIIEHNLDIIKIADYLVDLGPEGGNLGGQIIATGTPEEVTQNKKSETGKYLRPYLI
ncbi:MAG: excinuclease ABC subunit UvrA [Methylacidiphilales bacterium]|nr:excinuclease ABC subunit UvrA [Candidatus Methylacidiphilales bacterium]